MNADLASLKDSNGTAGSDSITITASDSFNNTATSQATAVTVNELPVITPASAQTIGVGQDTAISGISLAESGNTAGEVSAEWALWQSRPYAEVPSRNSAQPAAG